MSASSGDTPAWLVEQRVRESIVREPIQMWSTDMVLVGSAFDVARMLSARNPVNEET